MVCHKICLMLSRWTTNGSFHSWLNHEEINLLTEAELTMTLFCCGRMLCDINHRIYRKIRKWTFIDEMRNDECESINQPIIIMKWKVMPVDWKLFGWTMIVTDDSIRFGWRWCAIRIHSRWCDIVRHFTIELIFSFFGRVAPYSEFRLHNGDMTLWSHVC